MKLFELKTKNDYFTELIKIENFTNMNEALDRINKFLFEVDDLSEYDEDDLFYTTDKDGKDYKYVYTSSDGELSFVESLDEFDGKYKTENGWGVDYSIEIKE